MKGPDPASAAPVLVVGATGDLGGRVVTELLARGRAVRALVRPSTDARRLQALGVQIARGDMLDPASLIAAMTGVDAVISTAAGRTHGIRRAEDVDTVGNANLAEAAARTGVRRFVLTSILTADLTPQVAHFWHKKLAEDHLEARGVPFVALRPGAFLDQVALRGDPFTTHRLLWLGSTSVPVTFVVPADVAGYLAAAVDAEVAPGDRIDIGWSRPVSIDEVAQMASRLAGGDVTVRAIPAVPMRAVAAVAGLVSPGITEIAALFDWLATGRFVADTARQAEVFGPPPTPEEAIARFARRLGSR